MKRKSRKAENSKTKGNKEVKGKKAAPEPKAGRELNTKIYKDFLKFLEGRVSTECFVDIHDQCYGNVDCECECHRG